jgi:hypothetical protein
LLSAWRLRAITPDGPSSGVAECLIDRALDLHRDSRIAFSSEELLESGGGTRSVDQEALTDDLFAGCLIRPNKVGVIPGSQLGP